MNIETWIEKFTYKVYIDGFLDKWLESWKTSNGRGGEEGGFQDIKLQCEQDTGF